MQQVLTLLVLVMVANGAPVLLGQALGGRFARPLDGGRRFVDGRPLFGPNKTVRGVVIALVATGLVGAVLGPSALAGLVVGAGAMLGDLLSSFVKRRLGLRSGELAAGLDQIPEALLPLLLLRAAEVVSWHTVGSVVVAFLVLSPILSPLLYLLRLREKPW